MIAFVKGDVLNSKEQYIAQGVAEGNQEGLGTGLALKISKKWPDVQTAFKRHARSGRFIGGEIWSAPPNEKCPGIVYLATQPDMYHATLPFLRRALKNLVKWSDKNKIESVSLPKIGTGLGKLSWMADVKPLFVDLLSKSACRFVIYEQFSNQDEKA